jgi:hypothetical protein
MAQRMQRFSGYFDRRKRGFLFAGCDEGKVSVLDLKSGRLLGEASSGDGVDVIACDQKLAHVYLPCADSGTIAIVGISSSEAATVLKTAETVEGAYCATVGDRDQVYVCDPAHGKILVFKDALGPSLLGCDDSASRVPAGLRSGLRPPAASARGVDKEYVRSSTVMVEKT